MKKHTIVLALVENSPIACELIFHRHNMILIGFKFKSLLIILCLYVLILLMMSHWLTIGSPKQWIRFHMRQWLLRKTSIESVENDRFQLSKNYTATVAPETVHILMTANGMETIQRVTNILKSMLYYQNRVHHQTAGCLINIVNAIVLPCARNLSSSTSHPIHLHFISDEMTRDLLTSVLTQWNLTNINWTVYPMEQYEYKVNWIPNSHRAGVSAMIKLTLTTILPETVEKVLSIDTDMLLNDNIAELWDHFNQFNNQQIFGFAWEMDSDWPKCEEPDVKVIPVNGINGGLTMLHLKRMRQLGWEHVWKSTVNKILLTTPALTSGEQQVFRTIISDQPHLYYKIPCEWNVQVYAPNASECCHVIWPLRHPDQFDCWPTIGATQSFRPVKLVHYDRHSKPGDKEMTVDLPADLMQIKREMTTDEIRNRFIFTYYSFVKMPLTCFY